MRLSTARAGNVIGGGDFSVDRIIPDCVRAALKNEPVIVRNPTSIRPYQHVLEPLFAYLMIAEAQYENAACAGYYNIGPDDDGCVTTGELADLFCESYGEGQRWENRSDNGPHEANFLKLDCSKIKREFGWRSRWDIKTAVQKTVEWYKVYRDNGDTAACMDRQIAEYLSGGEAHV